MPLLTKAQVYEAMMELEEHERVDLLRQLKHDSASALTSEEKAELEAELEAYHQNPDDVVSWEDFKAELELQLRS